MDPIRSSRTFTSSFKSEHTYRPRDFRTPSPPLAFIEPIAPTHDEELDSRLPHKPSVLKLERSNHTPRHHRHHSSALDIIAAVATSPTYLDSPSHQRPPFSPISAIDNQSPHFPAHIRHTSQPSILHQRSTSEQSSLRNSHYFPDRPATSHVDHDLSLSSHNPDPLEQDAQLLLNFANASHLRTPQSNNTHARSTLSTDPWHYNDQKSPQISKFVDRDSHQDPSQATGVQISLTGPPPEKPRVHRGWPKGKPRGPRAPNTDTTKATRVNKRKVNKANPDGQKSTKKSKTHRTLSSLSPLTPTSSAQVRHEFKSSRPRRHSHSGILAHHPNQTTKPQRHSSAPLSDTYPSHKSGLWAFAKPRPRGRHAIQGPIEVTICEACKLEQNSSNGLQDFWIGCNGCKNWFHTTCVGFETERKVKDVDKFYCNSCEPRFGKTTFIRKSTRAHTMIDYAGLHEGKLRTAADIPEHHYIKPIKDGSIEFQPEHFPRMRAELVTAEYFEKSHPLSEPVVIPAAWNSGRPSQSAPNLESSTSHADITTEDPNKGQFDDRFDYDCMLDQGQDKLDMIIPPGLTVRKVAELYGPEEKVEVIDVKSNELEDKRWNMRQWADYYEAEGEKPVRNVISLEVSQSRLGRLIRRPKVVRDLDLQDAVWPEDELAQGVFPRVQFYCLMSVADCYTDFHIDFGGSSVYYHILKGKKTFFFISPTAKNLKKYEEWCGSPDQNSTFLGLETKECFRVDLSEGDTMLIPSGWIHAVWTPENSLVIGGNFLTRMHYGMQIQVNEIEINTGVARKFRYPFFQKVQWSTVIQYLKQDPVPSTVVENFWHGKPFQRSQPVYHEFNDAEDPKQPLSELFNSRFYSEGEIEGLPHLLRYVHRTVLVSLGKVPGVAKSTQDAVKRSLPKGYGEPMDLLKTFVMWVAWKRGNESIPQWAYPEGELSDIEGSGGDRKTTAATRKRAERQAAHDVHMTATDRRTLRGESVKEVPSSITTSETLTAENANLVILGDDVNHLPTSSTKQEDLPKAHTAARDLHRFGIRFVSCIPASSNMPKLHEGTSHPMKSEIEADTAKFETIPALEHAMSLDSKPVDETSGCTLEPVDITPICENQAPATPIEQSESNEKRSRSKACLECRKSKRRCIHDRNGQVDPVKARETPLARGNKRSRPVEDGPDVNIKRIKTSASSEDESSLSLDIASPLILEEMRPLQSVEPSDAQLRMRSGGIYDLPLPVADVYKSMKLDLETTEDNATIRSGQQALPTPPSHQDLMPSLLDQENHFAHGNMITANEPKTHVENAIPVAEVAKHHVRDAYSSNTNLVPESKINDSRSRTPSSRNNTNSTESVNASNSLPASPLTEVEHSSPIPDIWVNGDDEIAVEPVSPHPLRQLSRQRKKLNRFSNNANSVSPNAELNTSSRKSSRSGSNTFAKPQGVSKKRTKSRSFSKPPETVVSIGSPIKDPIVGSIAEGEDEKSLELVKILAEQEFGLRRRRS